MREPYFETREAYEYYLQAEAHIQMMRAVEPYIWAKVHAVSCMMPRIVISNNDQIERTYSPEDQKIIDEYDRLIAIAAQQVYHAAK